jgi:hypothetical protein
VRGVSVNFTSLEAGVTKMPLPNQSKRTNVKRDAKRTFVFKVIPLLLFFWGIKIVKKKRFFYAN